MAPDPFPSDAEIDATVAQLADVLGGGAAAALLRSGIDLGDHVRFRPLGARCRAAREAAGCSLADMGKRLRVPQRSIRSIERSEVGTIDGNVLQRLARVLEIEPFLAAWAARYPELASRTLPSVLTLRVTLADVEPRVWRRIQVPSSISFWELHVAIQDAMGWHDTHLHEFRLPHPDADGAWLLVGLPDDDFPDERPTEPGWATPIAPFLRPGSIVEYEYDFGDGWRHTIECEARTARDPAVVYPRCLDGERACPPEDVGGAHGYMAFLSAVRDPAHEDHRQVLGWIGGRWDPERFEAGRVRFSNATSRLRRLRHG